MTTKAERKPKKCKTCAAEYVPQRMGQKACSPSCALSLVQATRAKAERREIREAKQRAKTRGDWQREAQAAFNRYIRERDENLPCISCGRWHQGQWHAGHYMSVGSSPQLRFDEANCHKQCSICNNHLHGNLVNYRRALIAKIGLEAVEALETDNSVRKYSADQLKAIKADYAARARALKKERES